MKNGYILIADILGFSNIIKNTDPNELEQRIGEWVGLIKNLTSKYHIKNFQLLSDTLFVAIEGQDDKKFKSLISFSQELLAEGIKRLIPIKGAITYGNFSIGDFIYGKAVIEGHSIEAAQNWIGITLENDIPNLDENWGIDKIVCYPTPLKLGKMRLNPVIVWDIPNIDTLIKMTIGKGLTKDGDVLEWTWAEKVKNTIELKLYLQVLRKEGKSGREFYGFLPIQTIEINQK